MSTLKEANKSKGNNMERCLQRVEAVMSICNDYEDSPADIIADASIDGGSCTFDIAEIMKKVEESLPQFQKA